MKFIDSNSRYIMLQVEKLSLIIKYEQTDAKINPNVNEFFLPNPSISIIREAIIAPTTSLMLENTNCLSSLYPSLSSFRIAGISVRFP